MRNLSWAEVHELERWLYANAWWLTICVVTVIIGILWLFLRIGTSKEDVNTGP